MIARNTLDAYAMGTASSSGNLEASQVIDPSTGVIRDSVLDISTGRKIPVFGSANTDWQDEIYRKNAPMQQWSLNVSGGNRKQIIQFQFRIRIKKQLSESQILKNTEPD